MATSTVPAVEGWFTTGDEPRLLGTRCTTCGTVFFPAATGFCRNPACRGRELAPAELSRTGKVWSYTDAQYQPPPPYIPRARGARAVRHRRGRAGRRADRDPRPGGRRVTASTTSSVGAEVELVVEPLYEVDGVDHLIYRWKPRGRA